jgi:hypothetical protein
MDRFNLKNLNEGDVTEQYPVTTRNKFAALEISEDNGDINSARDNIRENMTVLVHDSLGYSESKHHKPGLDEEYSK